ncbi:hypothetical protein GBT08_19215 [Escherichia coli]|uniref:hypothetical protein n=1 Tax=Escherichia coli TaxID=562 RepID=UPI0014828B2E|nr:hypothetical protein [Escherichia coli]NNR20427.1 hypothetical protein [Escherichia coli]
MKMNWDSAEQIAAFFDFPDTLREDPVALRLAIIRKMASVHPDHHQGNFKDIETETLWDQLNSAKVFLDTQDKAAFLDQTSTQLIPLSQVTELVKVISQTGRNSIENSVSSLKAEARSDARSDGIVPRISSGVAATICAFLFAFPNTVKDNPIIGELLKNQQMQLMLLILSFFFAMLFMMTWSNEKRQEAKVDFLSTEEGLKHTLYKLSRHINNSRRFAHNDLIQAIRPSSRNSRSSYLEVMNPFIFSSNRLSMSLADKIASLQLDKLKQRGMIIELPQTGLDRTYEFSETAYLGLVGSKELNSEL